MIQKKALAVAVALASSTLLYGCGGGGGGSSSSDKNESGKDPSVQQVSLTGMVSKGTISHATVTAIELGEDGRELGEVGTATTGTDGRYELKLNANYQGGIVKLSVTPTANSKMVCDAFDGCGDIKYAEELSLPDSFSLNAYVAPAGTDKKVSVAVTPLTHMAAKRFEAGDKTTANLKVAVDSVSKLAGFDILTTEPVDISRVGDVKKADSNAQAYALFNSGLASLIFKDGSVEAAIRNLNLLANSFEDGKFDSSDAIKITDITGSVSNAVTKANTKPELTGSITEAVGKVNDAVAVIESGTDESGNFEPEVPDTSGKTELERGQEAIADLRTWINELVIKDFSSPVENYSRQLETVAETFDGDTQAAAQLAGYLVEQLADYLDSGTNVEALLSNGTGTLTIKDDNNQALGNLSLGLTSQGGLTFTLNGELTGEAHKTVTVSDFVLKTNLPANSLEGGVLKQFTGDKAELNLTGSIESASTILSLKSVNASLEATEVVSFRDGEDLASIEDKFNAASFSGDVEVKSGEHTFNGHASFNLVRLDQAEVRYSTDNMMSVGGISVNGIFTGPTGTLEAGATLSITNGTVFDTFGLLDWQRRASISTDISGELEQISSVIDTEVNTRLATGATVVRRSYSLESGSPYGNSPYVRGEIYYVTSNEALQRYESCVESPSRWMEENYWESDWGDYPYYCARYAAESLSVEESLWNVFDGIRHEEVKGWLESEWLDGTQDIESWTLNYYPDYNQTAISANVRMSDFEAEDYFAQGTLTLSTKVSDIADLPRLNVTATVSRDKLRGGTASLTLGWDNKLYRLQFVSEDVNPEDGQVATGTLTITDSTGVVIELNSSDLDDNRKVNGTVKVDGKEIGTVSTESGVPIVRFSDGKETSFQSLM